MAEPLGAQEAEIATSDELLIRRVSKGDTPAFELLVARHQRAAFAIVYRFLGDARECEDLAQEAFLRVFRNADSYNPALASFKTWFYQILANLCRDTIRKKTERVSLEDAADNITSSDNAAGELEQLERESRVRAAVSKLPTNQRLSLILCHYEGLTYSEAAKSLDLSVKAVESLIVRAKRCLRKELADLIEKRDD